MLQDSLKFSVPRCDFFDIGSLGVQNVKEIETHVARSQRINRFEQLMSL